MPNHQRISVTSFGINRDIPSADMSWFAFTRSMDTLLVGAQGSVFLLKACN